MAFAIVHFTVGFVVVLFALSVVPITRYRLTGAFLGGIVALAPDVHNFLPGQLGNFAYAIHQDPRSNVFFFHRFLDRPTIRELNFEFTLLSLCVLGIAFLVYDWRFGEVRRSASILETSDSAKDST